MQLSQFEDRGSAPKSRKIVDGMTSRVEPNSPGGQAAPARRPDPVLEEMVRRVVARLRPERIYLFGSRARGDAGPDSDYDLLVVVPDSALPGYKRDQIAFRALMGLGVAKDVIVLTRDEFERKATVVCSLAATVLREGELLYVA
jgi:predicted nucleotidyltransferase